jgi:hypothetical protein
MYCKIWSLEYPKTLNLYNKITRVNGHFVKWPPGVKYLQYIEDVCQVWCFYHILVVLNSFKIFALCCPTNRIFHLHQDFCNPKEL